jgi:hypothetical protein
LLSVSAWESDFIEALESWKEAAMQEEVVPEEEGTKVVGVGIALLQIPHSAYQTKIVKIRRSPLVNFIATGIIIAIKLSSSEPGLAFWSDRSLFDFSCIFAGNLPQI